jgi:hypothetical protein
MTDKLDMAAAKDAAAVDEAAAAAAEAVPVDTIAVDPIVVDTADLVSYVGRAVLPSLPSCRTPRLPHHAPWCLEVTCSL